MPNLKDKSVPAFDQTKAKLVAYFIVAVIFGLMLVAFSSSGGPETYEGDRVESRACLRCDGTGEVDGERCEGCLGAKKLKVIIPGPNHPAEVKGSVRDLSAFESLEKAREIAAEEAQSTKISLKPVKGAVGQATLAVTGDKGTVEYETKATGKFNILLKPGEYQVKVSAEGYQDKTVDLTVKPRSKPVWPKLLGRERMEEEFQVLNIFVER